MVTVGVIVALTHSVHVGVIVGVTVNVGIGISYPLHASYIGFRYGKAGSNGPGGNVHPHLGDIPVNVPLTRCRSIPARHPRTAIYASSSDGS
jgi:hypothetical protein